MAAHRDLHFHSLPELSQPHRQSKPLQMKPVIHILRYSLSSNFFFFFNLNFWFLILVMIDEAVKPQWKAAIDFKWIRENKEAVALNIEKRNSNANLETVLQLYDKMTHLQKVVILYSLIYANNHNQTLCIAFLFEFWKIQFHIDNSLVVSMCVNLCMCVYVSLFIY